MKHRYFAVNPSAAYPSAFTQFTCHPTYTYSDSKIGRITPGGRITEFRLPTSNSNPLGITAGPDGNLWFTEEIVNQIGRITPGGQITEFSLPPPPRGGGGGPEEITTRPDGNLWFTVLVNNRIGYITPGGEAKEFLTGGSPHGIAAGPDGNLWFTECYLNSTKNACAASKIGRSTPAGTITEFPLPNLNSDPLGITAGPDGNLWFTEALASNIGRITSGK